MLADVQHDARVEAVQPAGLAGTVGGGNSVGQPDGLFSFEVGGGFEVAFRSRLEPMSSLIRSAVWT